MSVSRQSMITASQEELEALVLDAAPRQGQWSEEDYLWLSERVSVLIELTDGSIEVLPMPTDRHQSILLFLYRLFFAAVELAGGKVLIAPLRLRIRSGKYREPDLLLVRSARDMRRQDRFWIGADLVLEVVSQDKPERDVVEKTPRLRRRGHPRILDRRPARRDHYSLATGGRCVCGTWDVRARHAGDIGADPRFYRQC